VSQSLPLEADICLTGRRIFLLLRNMEVHYRIYNITQLVCVLSHIYSINILIVSNVAGSTVSRATRLPRKLTKSYPLKIFTRHITFKFSRVTYLDQYGHHQMFKIIVEETAVLLCSVLCLGVSKVCGPPQLVTGITLP
jgi:hypothetical protein